MKWFLQFLLFGSLFLPVTSILGKEEAVVTVSSEPPLVQALQGEKPEVYEMEKEKLTTREIRRIVLEYATKSKDGLFHLIARVQTHQAYFANEIQSLLRLLGSQEAFKVVFKKNEKGFSSVQVAEKAGNKEVLQVLSEAGESLRAEERLRENHRLEQERHLLRGEVTSLQFMNVPLLGHSLAIAMTQGEGPGGWLGGAAALAAFGVGCYISFRDVKKIKLLNRETAAE